MTPKAVFRIMCEEEPTIPIFSRAWWLDAVAGDAWDVCLVKKGGEVIAAMPYFLRKWCGMTILSMPQLTQTLGPWLRKSEAKYSNRLGQEKDVFNELIRQLPCYAHFHQNWHFSNTNWLPFYWQGFQQTTRYTYRLPDLTDLDLVWAGFRENIRGDVRKASTRLNLQVCTDVSVDEFFALLARTFERQHLKVPYTREFIQRVDQACACNSARQIFIAKDERGRRHAGVYIVWDEQSAYYLMGGGDPELRSSGATSLCLWRAIQFAATVSKSFDFEGSMIEPIERFVRAFGATQTPYFAVTRSPSFVFRLRKAIRIAIQ